VQIKPAVKCVIVILKSCKSNMIVNKVSIGKIYYCNPGKLCEIVFTLKNLNKKKY
jgi:hypothetical protein